MASPGGEVVGPDCTDSIATVPGARLRRAFAEHHVLVMREQDFTADQFETAAQVFGEIQLHDKRERHVPGHPAADYVSNDPINNSSPPTPAEPPPTPHPTPPPPPSPPTLHPH